MRYCKKCNNQVSIIDLVKARVANKIYICPKCKTEYTLSVLGRVGVALTALIPIFLTLNLFIKVSLILILPILSIIFFTYTNAYFKE